MTWKVEFDDEFALEAEALASEVYKDLLTYAGVLEQEGPALGRPYVDTLKDSDYPNMKELRFDSGGGVWRVAFAFDPKRRAILLVAGNKVGLRGGAEDRFYKALIRKADRRFKQHLAAAKTRR